MTASSKFSLSTLVFALVAGCGSLQSVQPLEKQSQIYDEPIGQIDFTSLDHFRNPGSNWAIAKDVIGKIDSKHSLLVSEGGGVLVNKPTDSANENLFTKMEHGDIDLEIEVFVPHQSNSGIYFQSRYEIQILDSWRVAKPTFSDMGGIYERWDDNRAEGERGFEGIAPAMGVARAPGLWQRLEVQFRAPRFDDEGNKTRNALFKEVRLNGVVIHDSVEVSGPTRAAAHENSEVAIAPIMIQGDHGPVAFRNAHYKLYTGEKATLTNVEHIFVDGSFSDYSILNDTTAITQGSSSTFVHDIGQDRQEYLAEYRGTLDVPKSGIFDFELFISWFQGDPHFRDKDIGDAVLTIDGSAPIIIHKGPNEFASGSIELEAGSHELVLLTRKNRRWSRNLVTLGIEGPGIEWQILNGPSSLPPPSNNDPIILSDKTKPVIQHGFMNYRDEKKTHVMAIGGIDGFNFSIDLENGSLLHLWSGEFLDVAPMWQGRGNTQLMVPQGSLIELEEHELLYPLEDLSLAYRGFELDQTGLPILKYESTIGKISQSFSFPAEGGLRRTIKVDRPGEDLEIMLIRARDLQAFTAGHTRVNEGEYFFRIEGLAPDVKHVIRTFKMDGDLRALHEQVRPINGVSTFEYDLVW